MNENLDGKKADASIVENRITGLPSAVFRVRQMILSTKWFKK
jgi:hypothetical protein